MTVNISIRVPDGVVIASDSLASSLKPIQAQMQLGPIKCESCDHEMQGGVVQTPLIAVPGSSTPLASKLFYVGNYGVTFFGTSSLNGRSLFNHVMVFRTSTYKSGMTLEDIAEGLAKQLKEAADVDPNASQAPQGTVIVGFQVCGYDEADIDAGRTVVMTIRAKAEPQREEYSEYGVTVTGQDAIVRKLFANPEGTATATPNFAVMTLADAIDYARFLVQSTSDYHRFADMVPTVGGPTEVALVTKWIGFKFIERKKLLGDDTTRLNVGKIAQEIAQIREDLPEIIRESRDAPSFAGVE